MNEAEYRNIMEDLRLIKSRLVSIESWLAALSKDKNLYASHSFVKDITNLQERINPTIEIKEEKWQKTNHLSLEKS